MGNWRGLFSGGRYVQVIVIQRWPLSRFDCISISVVVIKEVNKFNKTLLDK